MILVVRTLVNCNYAIISHSPNVAVVESHIVVVIIIYYYYHHHCICIK